MPLKFIHCRRDVDWLDRLADSLRVDGFGIVEELVPKGLAEEARSKMYEVQQKTVSEIGRERLSAGAANETGVLRLMMRYEGFFARFLEIPELLAIVDRVISPTAVMHLQNGFILPSLPAQKTPATFQNKFHPDFPRYLNGYVASVNIFVAIDAFKENNGATLVVPGTHQRATAPTPEYLQANAVAALCPAGAAIVFDSTLWHAAGFNTSGRDRLAINHQFTHAFFKQQMDVVRSLDDTWIRNQPARTQQLLGYYTRLPTNLDEYYQPEDKRLYRKGQG